MFHFKKIYSFHFAEGISRTFECIYFITEIHKSLALLYQNRTHSAIIFREPERTHNSYWIQKRSFRWCLLYPLSNDESVPSVFICDGSATFSRNKMSRSCCTQLRNWKYKLYKNSSHGSKNVSWFLWMYFILYKWCKDEKNPANIGL